MSKDDERPGIFRPMDRVMASNEAGAMLENFTADRPSIEERMAAGKALRRKVSRDSHGTFHQNP